LIPGVPKNSPGHQSTNQFLPHQLLMAFVSHTIIAFVLMLSQPVCARTTKVPQNVDVLTGNTCPKSEQVRYGDFIKIKLSAFAVNPLAEIIDSDGAAEQEFVVGKHGIATVNKGVLGMCAGDIRRISVTMIPDADPIHYIVELAHISERKRLKEAL